MKIIAYSSLDEAHKDIFDKNWSSYFSKVAKIFHKGSPAQLGVFYFYKGIVYPESRAWNEEEIFKNTSGWRSFDIVHEDAWNMKIKKNIGRLETTWKDIPRGRVYFNGREFVVECDPILEQIPEFKKEVISKFSLPPEGTQDSSGGEYRTVFKFDPFYTFVGDESWR